MMRRRHRVAFTKEDWAIWTQRPTRVASLVERNLWLGSLLRISCQTDQHDAQVMYDRLDAKTRAATPGFTPRHRLYVPPAPARLNDNSALSYSPALEDPWQERPGPCLRSYTAGVYRVYPAGDPDRIGLRDDE